MHDLVGEPVSISPEDALKIGPADFMADHRPFVSVAGSFGGLAGGTDRAHPRRRADSLRERPTPAPPASPTAARLRPSRAPWPFRTNGAPAPRRAPHRGRRFFAARSGRRSRPAP